MKKLLPPIPTDRVEKISTQLNFLWTFMNEFKNLWFFIATFAGILILSLPFILPGDSNSTAIVIQGIQLSIAVFVFSMLYFFKSRKK